MINLSQKNVVKMAKETNFIKDNVEKVMRLADILEFVFSSKWKDKLVLKGGTALLVLVVGAVQTIVNGQSFSLLYLCQNCLISLREFSLILLRRWERKTRKSMFPLADGKLDKVVLDWS